MPALVPGSLVGFGPVRVRVPIFGPDTLDARFLLLRIPTHKKSIPGTFGSDPYSDKNHVKIFDTISVRDKIKNSDRPSN